MNSECWRVGRGIYRGERVMEKTSGGTRRGLEEALLSAEGGNGKIAV